MDAYIFNADILCEDCGSKKRSELIAAAIAECTPDDPEFPVDSMSGDDIAWVLGFDPEDETKYDSGVFPKGPYDNGGGEADCPQHCGQCGKFLHNPLTGDGYEYVITEVAEATGDADVLAEWDAEYLGDCELRDVGLIPLRDGVVYRLRTFDLWRERGGKRQLAYAFGIPGKPAIFIETTFGASPMHSISSDDCVRAMLAYITLRPGDTDSEYFERYTPEQMEFAKSYACEVLAAMAVEDSDEELPDFEPVSYVERLAGPRAYYPYIVVRNGVEYIDFDTMRADDRIRATYDPNDWSAGDWTYAEDVHTLYATGSGEALYRNRSPETYNPYFGEGD